MSPGCEDEADKNIDLTRFPALAEIGAALWGTRIIVPAQGV